MGVVHHILAQRLAGVGLLGTRKSKGVRERQCTGMCHTVTLAGGGAKPSLHEHVPYFVPNNRFDVSVILGSDKESDGAARFDRCARESYTQVVPIEHMGDDFLQQLRFSPGNEETRSLSRLKDARRRSLPLRDAVPKPVILI